MTTFPAVHSELLAQALLERVLPEYGMGSGLTCVLYKLGINDIYLVMGVQGRWVLRVSPTSGYSPVQVGSEMAMLRHLKSSGVAVAAPIARRDGADVTVIKAPEGERSVVLFEYIEHMPASQDTPERARQYGITLAQMHLAADSFRTNIQRPHHDEIYFVWTPLERLTTFPLFEHRTGDLAYLREAASALWQGVQRLPHTTPDYGFCHGDAFSNNALDGGNNELTLIDFDYCGIGWRVYDLATYIWLHLGADFGINGSKSETCRALLDGYQSVRPLTMDEFDALPYFAGLRQMFIFGAAIKNSSTFGMSWMEGHWLAHNIEFIRACLERDWTALVHHKVVMTQAPLKQEN